jgi:hypothetical protein
MVFQTILSDATGTRDVAASGSQKGIAALAVRRDAETAISEADGDLVLLQTTSQGRLKVSATPALPAAVSGSVTTSGTSLSVDVSRSSNINMHVKNTGSATDSASRYSFEASLDSTNGTDGTWFAIQAVRTNANTIETGVSASLALAAGTGLAYAWEASVNAYNWVRVRCTTSATASATMTWTIQPGSYATEPVPAIQTHAVTGSGNFAVTMAASATGSPAKAEDAAHASADVGVFALAVRNDNVAAADFGANNDYTPFAVDSKGAQFVEARPHTTTTLTNVASSATTVNLAASNANRRGLTIYNDSTQILYVKLGITASTTSFTIKLGPDMYYEVPFNYTGIIDGIWASANGFARLTEVTN